MIQRPIIAAVVAATTLASCLPCHGENRPPAKPTPAAMSTTSRPEGPEGKDWIFDQGLYTNNPKTGKRVWQYEKKKRAYRDPYSFFDSPHEAYPFVPDPYLSPYYTPYPYYAPYPYYPYPYYGPHYYAPPTFHEPHPYGP